VLRLPIQSDLQPESITISFMRPCVLSPTFESAFLLKKTLAKNINKDIS